MRATASLMVISISAFCLSCNRAPEPAAKVIEPPPAGFKIDSKSFEHKDGKCKDGPCVSVVAAYPVLVSGGSPSARAKINGAVQAWLTTILPAEEEPKRAASIEKLSDDLVSRYNSQGRKSPQFGVPWAIDRKVEILNQGPDIISLRFQEYEFLGGAHPNTTVELMNFWTASGEKVALAQLITDIPQLEDRAEEIFRQVRNIPAEQPLEEAGFRFDSTQFELNGNFGIGPEDLIFYYNAYEIAAYAAGPTEIRIPLHTISDLIKPSVRLR